MKYSVRDIGILTAYSALMLAESEVITALLLLVSGAASFFLLLVFGWSSFRKLLSLKHDARPKRSFIPLSVMCALSIAMPVFSSAILSLDSAGLVFIELAMLLGLSAASMPLLVNLDARHVDLDDKTLYVGYWTLCVGMATAGLTALVMLPGVDAQKLTSPMPFARVPAVIGMAASVFCSWYLLGLKSEPQYFADLVDEPETE